MALEMVRGFVNANRAAMTYSLPRSKPRMKSAPCPNRLAMQISRPNGNVLPQLSLPFLPIQMALSGG